MSNKYKVIGVMGQSADKKFFDQKNNFVNMFTQAAEVAKVRSNTTFFESSIIEIHKDDFSNFIEA